LVPVDLLDRQRRAGALQVRRARPQAVGETRDEPGDVVGRGAGRRADHQQAVDVELVQRIAVVEDGQQLDRELRVGGGEPLG
jgi:hypothetical protein